MRFKAALKKFAYETFRPHSQKEYAELFDGSGGERPYPWFYARVLLFSLLLFSLVCLGYSLSDINFIVVTVAGGIFADITFIVLLFELYPKKDINLLTPLVALFVGGLLSSAFIYVFYGIADYNAPFADQAWTAFVEETAKALTTIIILLVLKKRNPFYCLIIGAAVGGGYSAFENSWYMYTHGFMWGGGLSEAMQTGLWRALGTPFSHAAWAGAFGWAISGEKPWFKWQPYAVYAFNFVMHFFVNFPLMEQFSGWKGYPISAVTGVLSVIFIIYLLIRCRRSLIFESLNCGLSAPRYYPQINTEDGGYSGGNDFFDRYAFTANVLAAAAIFFFSFMLLGPTCVYGGEFGYKYYYYDDAQTVLNIVQSGQTFAPDTDREYVAYEDLSQNYSYTWTDGRLTEVVQREQYGEYFFRYNYYSTEYFIFIDEDGKWYACRRYEFNDSETYVVYEDFDFEKAEIIYGEDGVTPEKAIGWSRSYIVLEYGNASYSMRSVYMPNGGLFTYFKLNPNVLNILVEKDGRFAVEMRETVQVRLVESAVFAGVFCAASIGCGVAYIVFKVKSRRKNNVEQ